MYLNMYIYIHRIYSVHLTFQVFFHSTESSRTLHGALAQLEVSQSFCRYSKSCQDTRPRPWWSKPGVERVEMCRMCQNVSKTSEIMAST